MAQLRRRLAWIGATPCCAILRTAEARAHGASYEIRERGPFMFKHAVLAAAATAALTSAAHAETAPGDLKRCEALTSEATGLRGQVGEARAKKTAGFLAGVANRALVYAPGIDVGGGMLQRHAGQAVESELHQQASSGLGKLQDGGRSASSEKAAGRLKEIRAEAEQLNCPKA